MTSRPRTWLSSPSWGGQQSTPRWRVRAGEEAPGGVVSAAGEERRAAGTPCLATRAPLFTPRNEATPIACLRCQLTGRRSLLCSQREVCRRQPRSSAAGPLLLLGWAATVVALLAAIR